jgi:hypothetical protein
MSDRPDLILFTSAISARTQFVLPNADHIRSLPFDGFTVNIPQGWSAFSPDTRFTRADIRTWLDPLKDFSAGRDDWLTIYVDDPGDVFDDAAWADVIHNWTLLAAEAKRIGFEGILFDNEEYQGSWQRWPEGYTDAQIARGLEAYQDQTALRGRQIAEAVASVWSDAKIMVTHGPYVSAPYPNDRLPNQWGDPEQNALYGAFFTGMAEGAGPDMQMIDGGELYALRTLEQFQAFHDFRAETLPGVIPWDVDPELLANWDAEVDQAVMVYTQDYPAGQGLTPETLVPTLLNAFDTAEGAVYLFSENLADFDWLTPGAMPPGWIAAVERAVRLADHTERGTARGDVMAGADGAERSLGRGGDDRIYGGSGRDWLQGGDGDDTLVGGTAGDNLFGGDGGDVLRGKTGNDDLRGRAGQDALYGGKGDDTLGGGTGDDWMTGGTGADTFRLREGSGRDRVIAFDPTEDRIDLPDDAQAVVTVLADRIEVRLGAGVLILEGNFPGAEIVFV